MQKILVIGGLGFIGSHVVVALHEAGFTPVIVDNLSNTRVEVLDGIAKLVGNKPAFYEFDFRDSQKLEKVLKDEDIAGIIHFAAFKAVGESVADPLKYYDNNVAGFVSLLHSVQAAGVKNFVFSSSAAVYGEPPTEQVTEDTVCNPASPYGWSKYMDEVVLRDTCASDPSLKGVALRYFNVVGAHDSALIGELPLGKPQNLLPIIVQATVGKIPPLTVYGTDYKTPDGTCLRDYIHVVDLAKAHVAALQKLIEQDNGSYHVYNVGTGKPTSVLEMIKTFERINNVKVPYELGPRRPGDPPAYYAVPTKTEQELDWKADKTVEDAVRDAWRWQQTL